MRWISFKSWIISFIAPIGYLNVPKNKRNPATLILDPERAPIIRQIFLEYATGVHSLQSIWHSAKEKGLMSKEPNYNPRSKNFGKIHSKALPWSLEVEGIKKSPYDNYQYGDSSKEFYIFL